MSPVWLARYRLPSKGVLVTSSREKFLERISDRDRVAIYKYAMEVSRILKEKGHLDDEDHLWADEFANNFACEIDKIKGENLK